jgi:hypothetical protein
MFPFSFIGSRIPIDPDAAAFFTRVTTAGGTLSVTEQTAVNQLVLDMKSAGIWDSMKAIYPMVGASAAACAQNLKSSSFTGTFSSGWTFASTGATPNGTSAFMNTGFIQSGNLSVNSQSYSYYSRSNTSAGTKREMGLFQGSMLLDIGVVARYTGNLFYPIIGGALYPNASNTDSRGLFIANRTDASNVKGYINGTLVVNGEQTTANTTISIYLGARNQSGSVNEPSDRECSFAHCGDGLTDPQAASLYTAVQTFQTTLNRQV